MLFRELRSRHLCWVPVVFWEYRSRPPAGVAREPRRRVFASDAVVDLVVCSRELRPLVSLPGNDVALEIKRETPDAQRGWSKQSIKSRSTRRYLVGYICGHTLALPITDL